MDPAGQGLVTVAGHLAELLRVLQETLATLTAEDFFRPASLDFYTAVTHCVTIETLSVSCLHFFPFHIFLCFLV